MDDTHLNIGEGWAWAWHKRANAWFAAFVSVVLLYSIENVGAFDPIGSVTFYDVSKTRHLFLLPEQWDGKRLSLT